MDSGTKDFFRKLKRIQFWIICPLVIVTGLLSWWIAKGAIQKQRDANKSKIESYYTTLESLERQQRHANDKVSEGMEKLISVRRDEVKEAWTERWNQQTREDSIFKWPEKLRSDFISKVEGLRPIETTVAFPPEQELIISLRARYRDYIKDELPKLAEHIGAEWKPDSRRGGRDGARPEARTRRPEGRRFEGGTRRQRVEGGPGGMIATKAFDQSLVGWNPANQNEIERTHFDWSDPAPGLLDILYAHEDLTVLRSIMNIISKANEGAATRFNAAVKEIEFIRIGENASASSGRVFRVSDGGAASGRGGGVRRGRNEGDIRRDGARLDGARLDGARLDGARLDGARLDGAQLNGGRDEGGRRDGDYAGRGFRQRRDPADGRYVDKQYNPLPASTLRSVLKKPQPNVETEPIAPEFAYLAVAKRIPVRMRLRVDQRKLNRLLAECANSELTIEIRQIRINPDLQRSSAATQSRPKGRREGQQTRAVRNTSEELFQYDVDVELYGIIYVYNPVNDEVLGVDEESDETAEAGVSVAAN